jgi:hypothetical protein
VGKQQLLKCPCCGCRAYVVERADSDGYIYKQKRCDGCGYKGKKRY